MIVSSVWLWPDQYKPIRDLQGISICCKLAGPAWFFFVGLHMIRAIQIQMKASTHYAIFKCSSEPLIILENMELINIYIYIRAFWKCRFNLDRKYNQPWWDPPDFNIICLQFIVSIFRDKILCWQTYVFLIREWFLQVFRFYWNPWSWILNRT